MDNLDALKNWSAEQLASIHAMSWKTLSESFNHTGCQLAAVFDELEKLKVADEDPEAIDRTVVMVNALAFYQASLAKMMIAKHADKVGKVVRAHGPDANPKTMTVMCRDGKWIPGDLLAVHEVDQQEAEVTNLLATINSHEHGLFMRTAAKLHGQLTHTYESLGPVGKAVDVVIFPFNDAEDIDRLAVLVKMSAVMLNRSFEERWPEAMPS